MRRGPLLFTGILSLLLVASMVPAHPYPDTLDEEWREEDACWRYAFPEAAQREASDWTPSPLAGSGDPADRPRALLQGAAAKAGYDPAPAHALGEAALSEALLSFYATQGLDVGLEDRVAVASFAADLDPRLRDALAPLVQRQVHALRDHHAAFAGVTAPSERPDQARLVHAADGLLETVGAQAGALDALPSAVWPDEPVRDPAGVLAVGSEGEDTYLEHRFLQVDPGGDDLYRNNAGGGFYFITPNIDKLRYQEVAVHLDLDGDDRYLPPLSDVQGLTVAHGAGRDGVGVMADWQGNDTYRADSIAQGASFRSGVGVAWERHGNDTYRGQELAQGASMGGQGILVEEREDDEYVTDYEGSGYGRDFGVEAVGVLADVDGRDMYDGGGPSLAGYGNWGGEGVLLDDGEGDDSYVFGGNTWAANDARWSHADHGIGCDDG